jgi:polyprenyl-phospho-N-acetylgalactosaminyl synthase
MKFLIIIPAYNEAKKIVEVIDDLKKSDFSNVLIVNDGSIDETEFLIKNSGVMFLTHQINRGQGAAIKTGIDFAIDKNYEAVVFFDADGQMLVEEINNFIVKLNEGYEVVLGSRNLGKSPGMPFLKMIIKKVALIFTRFISGLNLTDTHNGFQAWRVSALSKINLNQDRFAYASELINEISRLKLKYIEIPVCIKYTDYSKNKGQKISGLFKILWDLLIR